MSHAPNLTTPDHAIAVTIPADAAQFRVLRVTAAVVGADLLDVAQVEDVQIGVEEAASLLLDAGAADRIEADLWCDDDRFRARLQATTGPGPAAEDDFRRTILAAVVDDISVAHDAGVTTVTFDKSA